MKYYAGYYLAIERFAIIKNNTDVWFISLALFSFYYLKYWKDVAIKVNPT